MKRMLYYIWKDIKFYLADPRALFLSLLFPLILILLVVCVYPPRGEGETRDFTFGLVSEEDSDGLSREVISYWEEGLNDPPFLNLTYDEALLKLNREEIQGFLLVPQDFSSRFYEGEETHLEIYTNPNDISARQAALRISRGLAAQISYLQNLTRAMQYQSDVPVEELLKQLRERHGLEGIPAVVRPAEISIQEVGPALPVNRINWALPAFFTMFSFLAMVLNAVDFVKERENHILERLLIDGIDSKVLLSAKFISSFLKGMIQAVILWGTGILLFNLYIGTSLLNFIWVTVSFIAAASAFSLLVACRAESTSQTFTRGVFISLVMAPLGGCWWPLYMMPSWMVFFGRFTPHYWANDAFYSLLFAPSAGFSAIMPAVMVLLTFTTFVFLYVIKNFDFV